MFVYGSGQSPKHGYPSVIVKNFLRMLKGQRPLIYGDGSQLRDFNYVDDAVDALLLAVDSEKAVGEVFNLGASPPVSLKDLAELLIRLNGSGRIGMIPFPEERRAIDIGDYYADFRKAEELLAWRPTVPLAEGLSRTLEFYQESGEHYV